MTAEHDIDQLYGTRPEDFTALRTKLVAAAKKRGDADGAKVIAAARRPTTAAWVVNALVRSDDSARTRLADLGERLRAAHASMDGARIRELSAAQRKLIDELVRAGLAAAELADPSAALRDDVTGTLQAAIADPEVAARLGTSGQARKVVGLRGVRCVQCNRGKAGRGRPNLPSPPRPPPPSIPGRPRPRSGPPASGGQRLPPPWKPPRWPAPMPSRRSTIGRAKLKSARRRYEKLLETLSAAEHEVDSADAELDAAETSARRAADDLVAAKDELAEADAALADLE